MASTRITVLQDQENATHQPGKSSMGMSRMPPKPFVQDNLAQATPRKALGDVRNIQGQRHTALQKSVLKSDKKSTQHGLQSHRSSLATPGRLTSFLKPSGTAKKANKNGIKILEDEKPTVKKSDQPEKQKSHFSQDKFQKETAFPFIDKDPEFPIPNYLADLSKAQFPESVWWPSFINPLKSLTSLNDFESDIEKLEVEDLPFRIDFQDSFSNALKTDLLDILPENDGGATASPGYLDLGPVEEDLATIDACCSFSKYDYLVRELKSIESICHPRHTIPEALTSKRSSTLQLEVVGAKEDSA